MSRLGRSGTLSAEGVSNPSGELGPTPDLSVLPSLSSFSISGLALSEDSLVRSRSSLADLVYLSLSLESTWLPESEEAARVALLKALEALPGSVI